MPALLAALSPDASRIASLVPTPGMAMRVQIRHTESAILQSTLLHRRKEGSAVLPEKLFFVSDSLVAAYSADLIVVWDLNRGVVANSMVPKKNHTYRDMAVSGNGKLYVLVWSTESQKAQIHCFQPETGKVQHKVKAGKGAVMALAVTETFAVVRQEDTIRILNIETGEKVAKHTSIKAASNQLVARGDLVVTVDGAQALLIHRGSGKRIGCLPMDSGKDTLDMWVQPQNEGFYLRVGSKIYSVSTDGTETAVQTKVGASTSVDRRVFLGRLQTVHALLQRGSEYQACQANLDADELDLDWKVPERKDKHSAKRKDAVLGPAQAGGVAASLADGPAAKKKKTTNIEDAEMEDALDEPEEGEQGPSIAERLKKLHEAFDEEDDDDDDNVDTKTSTDFKSSKATTESVTQLLEQALQSSDDGMLELALQVRDDKILQETCQALPDQHLLTMLNALTSRLASKPGRATVLCPWISAILKTGRAGSIPHLQPLRNLLEERVTVFPALLKLEGRLGMMTTNQ